MKGHLTDYKVSRTRASEVLLHEEDFDILLLRLKEHHWKGGRKNVETGGMWDAEKIYKGITRLIYLKLVQNVAFHHFIRPGREAPHAQLDSLGLLVVNGWGRGVSFFNNIARK